MLKATLFTDGGARGNPGPSGIGFVLTSEGREPIHIGAYIGETTNNQAEYQALYGGLMMARKEGVTDIDCFLDSELVVKQLNGFYRLKNADLRPWFDKIVALMKQFNHISFSHIPREKNQQADTLVNDAIDAEIKKPHA